MDSLMLTLLPAKQPHVHVNILLYYPANDAMTLKVKLGEMVLILNTIFRYSPSFTVNDITAIAEEYSNLNILGMN